MEVILNECEILLDKYDLWVNSVPGTNMASLRNSNGVLVTTVPRDFSHDKLEAVLLENRELLNTPIDQAALQENLLDISEGDKNKHREDVVKELRKNFDIVKDK